MKVYKSGCNWTGSKISFYDELIKKEIVFGIREGIDRYGKIHETFEMGSLVLITEGFNVRAIIKITSKPIDVTSESELKNENILERCGFSYEVWVEKLKKFGIKYKDYPEVYKGDLCILEPNDQFEYKCQAGIRRVRKSEIIEKAIRLYQQYSRKKDG